MANRADFNHQIRRTAIMTTALAACLIFGIVVLATGDWLPGAVIIGSTVIGVRALLTPLSLLVADLVAMWARTTLRHARTPPRRPVAI